MSLVEQAWETTVPPAVIEDRWHLLELDNGRVFVHDTERDEKCTMRCMADVEVMIAANAAEARRKAAVAAAREVRVRSYGHARQVLAVLA